MTLQQYFKSKNARTNEQKEDALEGVSLVVTKDGHGHNYGAPGSKLTFLLDSGSHVESGGIRYGVLSDGSLGNHISFTCLKLGEPNDKKSLKKELDFIAAQKATLAEREKEVNEKLAFLAEVGVDEFSENEYKAYMTLKYVDDPKLSKMEKAKAIAKLIEGSF